MIKNDIKMKRIFALTLTAFALTASAQIFNVGAVEPLAVPADSPYTMVVAMSHAGDFALLTTDTYDGIARYDFATRRTTIVTEAHGAGIAPALSSDDAVVAYREVSYDATHRRYSAARAANLRTGEETEVMAPSRDLCAVAVDGNVATAIMGADRISPRRVISRGDTDKVSDPRRISAQPVLAIDRGQLTITVGDNTRVLSPCGTEGTSYIWPSLSPDGTRVMFYLVGGGIYTCDLDGGNLKFVSDLRAPVWYDDDTIIAMNDIDGHDTQESSTLVAVRLSTGEQQVLCGGNDLIAMYPQASDKAQAVAFTTAAGAPYLLHLTKP